MKEQGLLALFKMLHYKFFTSLAFHYYKFGANKDIMESVIKSLSAKYDIVYFTTTKKYIPYIRKITGKENYPDVRNVIDVYKRQEI